uniref:CUB domain-containing protein n=1 Tax=Denticeps clupeoides TaxID=299321 RepID=A0AAY4A7F9_9TELE
HQVLSGEGGEFFSPDYLCAHPPLWCNWTIQVPAGKRVRLYLEDFTPSDDCQLKQDQIHLDESPSVAGGHQILEKCWRKAEYSSLANVLHVVQLITRTSHPPLRGFYGRFQALGPPGRKTPIVNSGSSQDGPGKPGSSRMDDSLDVLPEAREKSNVKEYPSGKVQASEEDDENNPDVVEKIEPHRDEDSFTVPLTPTMHRNVNFPSSKFTTSGSPKETRSLLYSGGIDGNFPTAEGWEDDGKLMEDFAMADSTSKPRVIPVKKKAKGKMWIQQVILSDLPYSFSDEKLSSGALFLLWLRLVEKVEGGHTLLHSTLQKLRDEKVTAQDSSVQGRIAHVSITDVNECDTQMLLCDISAECVNHFGSYVCRCLYASQLLCLLECNWMSSPTILKGIYGICVLLSVLLLLLLIVFCTMYRRHHQGEFVVHCQSCGDVSGDEEHNGTSCSSLQNRPLPPPPPTPIQRPKEGWGHPKEGFRSLDLPLLRFSPLTPSEDRPKLHEIVFPVT